MRFQWLLLLAAVPAYSQLFSAGVKAGVPLTDFVNTAGSGHVDYFTNTNRYIVGVTGDLHLPFGFGVELDVLYRHLNYQNTSMGVDTFGTSNASANAWEFPLLAKYRFPMKVVHPFVDAGVAWDTLQGLTQTIKTFSVVTGNVTTSTSHPSELNQSTTRGFVMGGGLDLGLLKLIHVRPEIRYTRWGAKHFFDINGLLNSNQNQAEFLVGITF